MVMYLLISLLFLALVFNCGLAWYVLKHLNAETRGAVEVAKEAFKHLQAPTLEAKVDADAAEQRNELMLERLKNPPKPPEHVMKQKELSRTHPDFLPELFKGGTVRDEENNVWEVV